MHNTDSAVYCRSIVKTFHTGESEVVALRGIDLDVKAGELFMLVGPSGCGKTTLISVIAGILNQDQGDCTVYGHNLKELSEYDRTVFRGSNIGFVFQSYNLIPTISIVENAAIPLLINGKSMDESLESAAAKLTAVGLGDRLNSLPTQLSGGQQQRVAIARALVHNPRLIVCDEPTAALDHETGSKIMDIFKQVAVESGRALIVVTHDARIFGYADRIAKLNDGMIEKIVDSPGDL